MKHYKAKHSVYGLIKVGQVKALSDDQVKGLVGTALEIVDTPASVVDEATQKAAAERAAAEQKAADEAATAAKAQADADEAAAIAKATEEAAAQKAADDAAALAKAEEGEGKPAEVPGKTATKTKTK